MFICSRSFLFLSLFSHSKFQSIQSTQCLTKRNTAASKVSQQLDVNVLFRPLCFNIMIKTTVGDWPPAATTDCNPTALRQLTKGFDKLFHRHPLQLWGKVPGSVTHGQSRQPRVGTFSHGAADLRRST